MSKVKKRGGMMGEGFGHAKRFLGFGVALALIMLLTMSGCIPAFIGDSMETEPAVQQGVENTPTVYYDFGDVLIPEELKINKERSFIYHAADHVVGVLALSGRVHADSLIQFFSNSMVKDNWRLVSMLKSPTSIMFFSKTNRSCIISITDKTFNTEVEIWVAPIGG